MIKRILVGLGGTPITAVATQRAVELAQAHEAQLTGVTVVDWKRLMNVGPIPLGAGTSAQSLREHRVAATKKRVEEAVAKFEAACSEAGIAYKIERETGNPFDLMISHARYHDLMIFGLRSLFDYGIVDEPRDILVRFVREGVRPIVAAAPEYRAVKRVLIAYSGSMESAKAMKRFVQLRPWREVSLQIVCFEKEREAAMKLLDQAGVYCRAHGFDPELEYVPGSPKGGLLPHAQKCGADLIVMGNSLRSLLFRHLLGDTMLHTIRHADRPLFLAQ